MIKKTLLFSLLIANAHAEYRVYQYVVKNKVQTTNDQPVSQIITSSLNPQSYIAYHGGNQLISLDLLRTWMCPGSTAKMKKICPSPYGKLPKEIQ